jgi:hypothetical protein
LTLDAQRFPQTTTVDCNDGGTYIIHLGRFNRQWWRRSWHKILWNAVVSVWNLCKCYFSKWVVPLSPPGVRIRKCLCYHHLSADTTCSSTSCQGYPRFSLGGVPGLLPGYHHGARIPCNHFPCHHHHHYYYYCNSCVIIINLGSSCSSLIHSVVIRHDWHEYETMLPTTQNANRFARPSIVVMLNTRHRTAAQMKWRF